MSPHNEPWLVEVTCRACSWHAEWGREGTERYLRRAGMLRRVEAADGEVVRELLHGTAPQLTCPECGEVGLRLVAIDEADWCDAVLCDVCRQPLTPERLEAVPDTKRCVACQQQAEVGVESDEPEYCPRCGSLLVLRVSSRAGMTRYRLFCTGEPPCRLR